MVVVARHYQNFPLPTLTIGELTVTEDSGSVITPGILTVTGDHPLTRIKNIVSNLQKTIFN